MERGIKILIAFLTMSFATLTHAEWTWDDWGFKPNIGFDAGVRKQAFETGFGEGHFRKNYPYTNFYIGTKMFKYLGLELGYEHMYRLDERKYYGIDQPILGFGNNLALDEERLYFSHAYSKGWHASLEGYLPICPKTKTYLTATAGITWLKMYYDTLQISEINTVSAPSIWESDRRAVARVGLGIRQMITDYFGVRLQAIWEDTSKLEGTIPVAISQGGTGSPVTGADNYTARPKDGYIFNLGFFLEMA